VKTLLATAAAALALIAGPALAQTDHAAGDAANSAGAAKPMDMSKMTPEEMHKHCSMIMGGKMQGQPKHNHSSDKLGHAPTFNKPSDAEMKAMHEKCAAMMADAKKAPAPAKP
jgi:hypothetical protein